MTAGMHHHHGLLTPRHQPPAPALLHHRVQTPDKLQRRRADLGLVQPRQLRLRRKEATIHDGELERMPAVGVAQRRRPVLLARRRPPGLQHRRQQRRHEAALREADDAVDAPAGVVADALREALHALLQQAVGARGFVFAEPRPGIGGFFGRLCGRGRLVAGDVGGGEAGGRGGVDERWGEVEGLEGFGEEFF